MLLLWHSFYANVYSKPRNLEFTHLIFLNVTLIHSPHSSDLPHSNNVCFLAFISSHLMVLYFCFSWMMYRKQKWKWKKEHVAPVDLPAEGSNSKSCRTPCSSLSAPRTVQTFKCGEVVRPFGNLGWQVSNPNTFVFHSRILGFFYLHFLSFAYIYKISLVKIMKIFKDFYL